MSLPTHNHIVSNPRSTAKFHNFLKLPVELQIMIWSFYWPHVPIRHYFTIDASGCKEYGALNLQSGRFINRSEWIGRRKHLFDRMPFLKRIELPGTVQIHGVNKRTRNPIIYVDFSLDIFYFDFCTYYGNSYKTRQDEWFRFLRCPIYQVLPDPLLSNHWIFQVQHIAFFIPRKGLCPSFWDYTILQKMKSLKTVWLVTFQLNRGAALSFWDTYSHFVTDGRESNELSLQMHARGKITEDCLRAALKRYHINAQLIIARNGPADVA